MGNLVAFPLLRNLPPYYDPRQVAPPIFDKLRGFNSLGQKTVIEETYHEESTLENEGFLEDVHKKFLEPHLPLRIKILKGLEKAKPELFPVYARRFHCKEYLVRDLHAEYKLLDKDGDGLVDWAEFNNFLDMVGDGSDEEKRRQLWQEIDANSEGLLDFEEFLRMVFDYMELLSAKDWDPTTANPIKTMIGIFYGRIFIMNDRLRSMDVLDHLARRLI